MSYVVKFLTLLVGVALINCQGFGQLSDSTVLTVSTYNVLNLGVRDFTFRGIDCGHVIPALYSQIVVLQEVVDSFRVKSIAEGASMAYAPLPFLSKTNNTLLYDSAIIALIDETIIPIGDHYASQWRIIVRSTGDTVIIIGCQLSEGEDTLSQMNRSIEAQALRYHIHTTSLSKFIIAGSLNVRSSDDQAYRWLTDKFPQGDSILKGQTFDPARSPGIWHDNKNFALLHSASTRINLEKDSGAGGGLIDRFDFILLSQGLLDSSFVPNSYRVRFNKGLSFRDSIRAQFPQDFFLGWAQNASDHLPVLVDLVMRRTVSSVGPPPILPKNMDLSQGYPTEGDEKYFENTGLIQPFRISPLPPSQSIAQP